VIIEIIKDKHNAETRQARHDWAEVTRQEQVLKPTQLKDTRTGEKYSAIMGAIGYPAGLEPGCVMVVGVKADEPNITILEYAEKRSVYNLYDLISLYRQKYGHGRHSSILSYWIGDQEKYQSICVAVSSEIEKRQGEGFGIYIRNPIDWEEPAAFPLFMWRLKSALEKNELSIPGSQLLTSRLQEVQPDQVDKGKVSNFPGVGGLGGLVHTIMIERPWLQDADYGKSLNMEI
jgi:hypothetical protein